MKKGLHELYACSQSFSQPGWVYCTKAFFNRLARDYSHRPRAQPMYKLDAEDVKKKKLTSEKEQKRIDLFTPIIFF